MNNYEQMVSDVLNREYQKSKKALEQFGDGKADMNLPTYDANWVDSQISSLMREMKLVRYIANQLNVEIIDG